ncbi:hypothetical protein LCGC14_2878340, partial [marine sediment metagenome]
LADGDVIPCCRGVSEGMHKLMVVGNVHKTPLKYIWKSKKMTILRNLHRAGNSHASRMCRVCGLRKEVIRQNGEMYIVRQVIQE